MSDPENDNDALPAVAVPRRGQLESERARFAARADGGRLAEGLEPPPPSRAATVRAFVRDPRHVVLVWSLPAGGPAAPPARPTLRLLDEAGAALHEGAADEPNGTRHVDVPPDRAMRAEVGAWSAEGSFAVWARSGWLRTPPELAGRRGDVARAVPPNVDLRALLAAEPPAGAGFRPSPPDDPAERLRARLAAAAVHGDPADDATRAAARAAAAPPVVAASSSLPASAAAPGRPCGAALSSPVRSGASGAPPTAGAGREERGASAVIADAAAPRVGHPAAEDAAASAEEERATPASAPIRLAPSSDAFLPPPDGSAR